METPSYKDFFAGKRVTVMGLGLLGRGIGDVRFLAECGATLVVTDKKTREELAPALASLADLPAITFVLGEHRLEDFKNTDMVIKAAGVPLNSPYIAEAEKNGVPVYMTTALFAKFAREAGATIVGVTGTRGKSTTTHLIYYGLKEAGKSAHLGGNVRGLSTLALLPSIQDGDIVVLELDSWQLQGFGALTISPDVAVFTNLLPDHLNYYADMDLYFEDKANIFRNQHAGNSLVVGPQVAARVQAAHPPVAPNVPDALPPEWKLQLLGEHNRENASLAAAALQALGLEQQQIKTALENFKPVEGRLQKIAEIKGVTIYNDNNATTPDATLAALASFPSEKTILIAGGADKGLVLGTLAEGMRRCKKVLLLEGTGTDRLKKDLGKVMIYHNFSTLLADALGMAEEGDAIVFSPGFASFGLFKNEYDRNDQFVAAVQALQK